MLDYLRARGVKSQAMMARAGGPALDSDAFKARILQPYLDGWTDKDGFVHKIRAEMDPVMVEAAIVASYEDAVMARSSQMSSVLLTQTQVTISLADAQARLQPQTGGQSQAAAITNSVNQPALTAPPPTPGSPGSAPAPGPQPAQPAPTGTAAGSLLPGTGFLNLPGATVPPTGIAPSPTGTPQSGGGGSSAAPPPHSPTPPAQAAGAQPPTGPALGASEWLAHERVTAGRRCSVEPPGGHGGADQDADSTPPR